DNVPIPEKLNITLNRPMPNDLHLRDKMAGVLTGLGFKEIVTNSIVNSKYYPGHEGLVKMLNSLTSELDVLRLSMMESVLEVLQYNCNWKNTNLALFEYGKIYGVNDSLYTEQNQLALFVTGAAQPQGWNRKELPADIFLLKGVVNN